MESQGGKKMTIFIAVRKCGDPRYSHDLQPPDKWTMGNQKMDGLLFRC